MKAKDISNLYLFCQAVECGGFAAASLHTHVSAPTLSRAVAHLEEQLGEKLVHRNAKQFQLTSVGEEYFQKIAPIFATLDQEWLNLANNQPVLSGEIRISCPEPFADNFLQQLAIEFMQLHPEVTISIIFSTNTERFFEERIDLALVTTAPDINDLVQRKLFESPLVMAAAPCYIEQQGVPQQAEDLVNHALLSGTNSPFWELKQQGKTLRIPYKPKYSVNSLRLNVDATLAGAGICMLPMAIFERLEQEGKLVRVLADVECPMGKAYLLWADQKLISARVQAFRNMIFERFSQPKEFLISVGSNLTG